MCASTEMTYASVLAGWIEEISAKHGLPFNRVRVEQIAGMSKRADILVYGSGNKVALVIEVKRPEGVEDPSEPSVVNQAFDYAVLLEKQEGYKIRYIATHNVNFLHLWSGPEVRTRIEQFAITSIEKLDDFESHTGEIKQSITRFLIWFEQFLTIGKKPRPFAISTIEILKNYVSGILSATKLVKTQISSYNTNPEYRTSVEEWLVDEGAVKIPQSPEEIEEVLRVLVMQYIVLFVNKLLFYNVLKTKIELPDFRLDSGISPLTFHSFVDSYFKAAQIQSRNYETVFQTGFVDSIPIDITAIREIQKLTGYLNQIDFSSLSYDLIGSVFESFIQRESRHRLGQFFTTADVTDLILGFCVKSHEDTILDPSCGSGTFLTRAYYRLAYLGERSHEARLNKLWGFDIAKFPVHLATMNLAIRDLSDISIFPRIAQSDFFKIKPTKTIHLGTGQSSLDVWFDSTKSTTVRNMRNTEIDIPLPDFQSVIGNPPYIRQEKIKGQKNETDYRAFLRTCLKEGWPHDNTVINLPDNANIYAHFFIHGAQFLSGDGKRLGFVSLRSWLESGFGHHLQRFFLEKFKVVAIMESKVERWFEDAQMLPIVTILERETDSDARDANPVKFIRFSKPLFDLFPSTGTVDFVGRIDHASKRMSQETLRWKKIDSLLEEIEGIKLNSEEDLRSLKLDFADVSVVKQSELDASQPWAQYLRASPIYLSIIQNDQKRDSEKQLLTDRDSLFFKRRGITAGEKNMLVFPSPWFDDFEMDSQGASMIPVKEEIEGQLVSDVEVLQMCKDWFFPLVNKIRTHNSVLVSPSSCDWVFSCSHSPESLKECERNQDAKALGRFIEIGRQRKVLRRKTLQQRANSRNGRWYDLDLTTPEGFPLFIPSLFGGSRMFVLLDRDFKKDSQCLFSSDNYWELWTLNSDKADYWVIGALLNSTFSFAGFEFNGRLIENRDHTKSLQIKGPEIDRIQYIHPKRIPKILKKEISKAFEQLSKRPFETLFLEVQKQDRQHLDEIILCQHLGLASQEMWGLYLDVCKSSIDRTRMWIKPTIQLKKASDKCSFDVNIGLPPDSDTLEVPFGRPLFDLCLTLLNLCHREPSQPVNVKIIPMRIDEQKLVMSFYQIGVKLTSSEVNLLRATTADSFPLKLIESCVEVVGGALQIKNKVFEGKDTTVIRVILPYRRGS